MKIHIPDQFCVYRQTYKNMESPVFYGKVENAFKPRFRDGFEFQPFEVEFMAFCWSMKEAAEIAAAFRQDEPVPVMCHDNGVVYRNVKEAAKALGMHVTAIRNHLRGEPGFEKPKGHTFQRVPRELYDSESAREAP